MAERYSEGPHSGAIALAMEKHGLAVWGDTAKECYARLASVISRAEAYVEEQAKGKRVFAASLATLDGETRREKASAIAPVLRGEVARAGWRCVLAFDDTAEVLDAVSSDKFPELAKRGVMTPEHIMRAGRRALVLGPDASKSFAEFRGEYEAYIAANGQTEAIPDWLKVIAVPGVGAFFAGKDRKSALIAATCYKATLKVMEGAQAVQSFESLSEADACEMEYWPLERRKIAEGLRATKALDGKVALVIGAASGIGRATAQRFAAEGAHVVLADLDVTRAQEAANQIGDRAFAIAANAGDPASMEGATRETVLRFGGIDVLFYSPGVAPGLHAVAEMSDEEVATQLAVHYQGAVAATRAASQAMLAQGVGGRLIYNASKAAVAPGEGAAAYGAAKAALVHYVRNAANELSRHGITANYVNADAIDTPLFKALVKERAERTGQTEEQVLARYAERSIFRTATVPAEAVAEAALWLASDASVYTSGCVITVGGGAEAMPR